MGKQSISSTVGWTHRPCSRHLQKRKLACYKVTRPSLFLLVAGLWSLSVGEYYTEIESCFRWLSSTDGCGSFSREQPTSNDSLKALRPFPVRNEILFLRFVSVVDRRIRNVKTAGFSWKTISGSLSTVCVRSFSENLDAYGSRLVWDYEKRYFPSCFDLGGTSNHGSTKSGCVGRWQKTIIRYRQLCQSTAIQTSPWLACTGLEEDPGRWDLPPDTFVRSASWW